MVSRSAFASLAIAMCLIGHHRRHHPHAFSCGATFPEFDVWGRRRPERRRPLPVATDGPTSAIALRLERRDVDEGD
jgi:hypothetical protein